MAKFNQIDEKAFESLATRSRNSRLPFAETVRFDRRSGKLRLTLNTGMELVFNPREAYGLKDASDDDLVNVEVEGAGGAIHFPALDADFSVARLVEGYVGPTDWGRKERRKEASRRNGMLGGRPKKAASKREAEHA